jgi:hypothetical protein
MANINKDVRKTDKYTQTHRRLNMSKTPYEVRLELLKLSQGLLFDPVYSKRDTLINEWEHQKELDKATPYPTLPSFPTTEDVIEEAEKLNRFISNG